MSSAKALERTDMQEIDVARVDSTSLLTDCSSVASEGVYENVIGKPVNMSLQPEKWSC